MILIDYTGVAIAGVMAQREYLTDSDDPSLYRHIILNVIRNIRNKFKNYGDVVICADRGASWRRDHFPYYKASRRASREDDTIIDWTAVFKNINLIFDEMSINLPFYCIAVDRAEADDILAILAVRKNEKSVVVSNDKDLVQLTVYDHIEVYSPMKDQKMRVPDPHKYLFEHIIRGDTSDGIPNIKSVPDSFVSKIRQKSVYAKEIEAWFQNGSVPDDYKDGYERNKKLISLHEIPDDLADTIVETFDSFVVPRGKVFNYFVGNKLKNLMEAIEDFT